MEGRNRDFPCTPVSLHACMSHELLSPYVHACACVCMCSVVSDSATLWTMIHQASLSMGFPRQKYWNGLRFPSLGNLPNPGIEPTSLVSLALARGFFTTVPPGKPFLHI